jgi:hypothetical protein
MSEAKRYVGVSVYEPYESHGYKYNTWVEKYKSWVTSTTLVTPEYAKAYREYLKLVLSGVNVQLVVKSGASAWGYYKSPGPYSGRRLFTLSSQYESRGKSTPKYLAQVARALVKFPEVEVLESPEESSNETS